MSSIREVALAAGVSIATVSRALSTPEKVSKNTLERVQAAIEKMDYRPNIMARNFRAARSYSIVVLVPDFSKPLFSAVIQGIQQAAQQAGYAVLLGDTQGSLELEKEYINLVHTRQSDGVIQLGPQSGCNRLSQDLNTPFVSVCGERNTRQPAININNVAAARTVVDFLLGQGHQNIGMIAGKANSPQTQDRLQGYCQALEHEGLTYDKNLVVYGDYSFGSGVVAAKHFASMKHRPTAIFSMNDEMAIGAMQGLRVAGIQIPQEIAIAGFDNIEFSQFSEPPLTTVSQPAKNLGQTAFNTLLQLIEGNELQCQEITLPHELIVRQSTPTL